MILYLDILFVTNWGMDFLLLHGTARLLRIPHRGWRTVAGAAVGALTACAVLLPPMPPWLSVCYNAAAAWLTVGAAFGFRGRAVWRRCGVFFLLSTAVAGVAMAVYWLFAPRGLTVVNGVVYCDLPPLLLVGCTAAAYGLFCLYDRLTTHRRVTGRTYELQIRHRGEVVTLPAFYDSGNRLREPFSGASVAVAPYDLLKGLLSPAWHPDCPTLPHGARPVPYTSVGGRGVLAAFCPERMWVVCDGVAREVTGGFVAVSREAGERVLIGADFVLEKEVTLC
ncbi:MAG: hypothetical protein E7549_00590 [Ruminococcaceae bacterium]|nr:hypothetical protein [Oscillospiraceae bacterium]